MNLRREFTFSFRMTVAIQKEAGIEVSRRDSNTVRKGSNEPSAKIPRPGGTLLPPGAPRMQGEGTATLSHKTGAHHEQHADDREKNFSEAHASKLGTVIFSARRFTVEPGTKVVMDGLPRATMPPCLQLNPASTPTLNPLVK